MDNSPLIFFLILCFSCSSSIYFFSLPRPSHAIYSAEFNYNTLLEMQKWKKLIIRWAFALRVFLCWNFSFENYFLFAEFRMIVFCVIAGKGVVQKWCLSRILSLFPHFCHKMFTAENLSRVSHSYRPLPIPFFDGRHKWMIPKLDIVEWKTFQVRII